MMPVADLSYRDDLGGNVAIYPHGYALRVKLNMERQEALERLSELGWCADRPSRRWSYSTSKTRGRVWVMRGSVWLTERAPRNRRLPLKRFNDEHRTRFHNLAIVDRAEGLYLDLQGTRIGDVQRLLEGCIGLAPDESTTEYYRRLERYIVLPPQDAFRLARALGSVPAFGKGRQRRKQYLVRDHKIPITVKKRTNIHAHLTVYRIHPGATAGFKCEVSLIGRSDRRLRFSMEDLHRLDKLLLDLVDTYGLRTRPKPSRWEPRNFSAPRERGRFDTWLRRTPIKAHTGARIKPWQLRFRRECHTPEAFAWTIPPETSGTYGSSPHIRASNRTEDSMDGEDTSPSSPPVVNGVQEVVRGGWERREGWGFEPTLYVRGGLLDVATGERRGGRSCGLAHAVSSLPGMFHEVVLDSGTDPGEIVRSLAAAFGDRMHLSVIRGRWEKGSTPGNPTTSGWASVWDEMVRLGNPADAEVMVVVLDESVAAVSASVDVAPLGLGLERLVRATGALLWSVYERLVRVVEEDGLTVVVVSVDMRSNSAHRPVREDLYTDRQMRSLSGDAGRYFAHVRYRQWDNGDGWLVLKDYADGLPGMILPTKAPLYPGVIPPELPAVEDLFGSQIPK